MLMGSLIEELQRREAAARQEADELRGEIARLNERLARAEERLSRLEITGETVAEILGAERRMSGRGAEAAAAAGPGPAGSRVADGGPGRPARRPGPRLAGGVPRPASGCTRCRRTRPRCARARLPGRRPGPAAAPVTSPDPASPRSRPGRKTRTAAGQGHARPPCGARWPPPRASACRRPRPAQPPASRARPSRPSSTHLRSIGADKDNQVIASRKIAAYMAK